MDTIWRNAAKKVRACEKQAASHITTTTATTVPTAVTGSLSTTQPTPIPFYNAETMTLEELMETHHRLIQDWPPDDGIPFPEEILEVFDVLRLKIIA
jgi:hypothetical protein